MINIQALFNAYNQFMQNPNQVLQQLNVPENYRDNPQSVIQYLMNNGKISQEQYNLVNQQARQLQNNPLFKKLFNK